MSFTSQTSETNLRWDFTPAETQEIRSLLDSSTEARLPIRRMNAARLRHLGVPPEASTSRERFERLIEAGRIGTQQHASLVGDLIVRRPPHRVFRVAVGVSESPVPPDWSAFGERFHWFGEQPKQLSSGDHLFVLAVGHPWRSVVVGLYEAISAGAIELPDSPDPSRWPYALGVKPLAAIAPQEAVRVEGQQGPQSGLPERIYDEAAIPLMYEAVAKSRLPPGPETLEQRVQELEVQDFVDDVLEAVDDLGREAREPAVAKRAIEIGGWSAQELQARAWYTGTGPTTHVANCVAKGLRHEHTMSERLERQHGSSPFRIKPEANLPLGVGYRRTADRPPPTDDPRPTTLDLAKLEQATARHMQLQDRLADALLALGLEPRSAAGWGPKFDLAFIHDGVPFCVEVKTGEPVPAHQVRLGAGQVLEYCHQNQARPVLLLEGSPPPPWTALAKNLGIGLLSAATLEDSLTRLLDG